MVVIFEYSLFLNIVISDTGFIDSLLFGRREDVCVVGVVSPDPGSESAALPFDRIWVVLFAVADISSCI